MWLFGDDDRSVAPSTDDEINVAELVLGNRGQPADVALAIPCVCRRLLGGSGGRRLNREAVMDDGVPGPGAMSCPGGIFSR